MYWFMVGICLHGTHFRTYNSFEELVSDYEGGELHPGDLKPSLAKALNKILQVSYLFMFLLIVPVDHMVNPIISFYH